MAQLHQTRGQDFRKYGTLPDGVQAEYRLGGHYRAYKLTYEDIDFDEIVSGSGPTAQQRLLFVSVTANVVLGLAVALFLLAFATWALWVAGLLGAVLAVGLYLWGRRSLRGRRHKTLEGNEDLYFFYEPDHREAVDVFVGELKREKTAYLHRKYLRIDRLLPLEDQKASVDWLYQNEQIDRRIYQVYLEEYEHLRLLRGN